MTCGLAAPALSQTAKDIGNDAPRIEKTTSTEENTGLKQKLVPHKALYDIRLSSLKSGAQITNLYGQMFFEWKNDCEAWVSDHRSNLFYEYSEGGTVNITTDFATYESLDGKSMSFNTRREQGGKLFEEFRGYADSDTTKDGKAHYTIPDGMTYELPAGTLFPMQHTVDILEKAKNGAKIFNATIFDGSDDEGPHDVNTFILPMDKSKLSYISSREGIDESLLSSPAWQLRMAYFPLNEPTSESADYEMTLIAHENGVVSYASIDYDKFSLEQRLVALEELPAASCE